MENKKCEVTETEKLIEIIWKRLNSNDPHQWEMMKSEMVKNDLIALLKKDLNEKRTTL